MANIYMYVALNLFDAADWKKNFLKTFITFIQVGGY